MRLFYFGDMLGKIRKILKRRVDINFPLPDNKFGGWLKKDVKFVPSYFKEAWRELKKVTWPSRKDTWKLFVAVIVFSVFLAIIITIADNIFEKVIERIFL